MIDTSVNVCTTCNYKLYCFGTTPLVLEVHCLFFYLRRIVFVHHEMLDICRVGVIRKPRKCRMYCPQCYQILCAGQLVTWSGHTFRKAACPGNYSSKGLHIPSREGCLLIQGPVGGILSQISVVWDCTLLIPDMSICIYVSGPPGNPM